MSRSEVGIFDLFFIIFYGFEDERDAGREIEPAKKNLFYQTVLQVVVMY